MAEGVFRSQDLMARHHAEADKARQRSHAQALQDMRDEAEHLAFMGRPALSAVEYYLLASDAADRREEAERKRGQARQLQAQERRIAELEAEVAASHTRAERLSRNFGQAVEGWSAARRRSEGASFRGDDQDPVVGYRTVRGGQVEVRSSEVTRYRAGGPILGID